MRACGRLWETAERFSKDRWARLRVHGSVTVHSRGYGVGSAPWRAAARFLPRLSASSAR